MCHQGCKVTQARQKAFNAMTAMTALTAPSGRRNNAGSKEDEGMGIATYGDWMMQPLELLYYKPLMSSTSVNHDRVGGCIQATRME